MFEAGERWEMSADPPRPPIRVGEWIVEPALDTIIRGGETRKLEPRAMRLLMCLADSAGAVVSIERLLDNVWAGVIVSPASVYQAVSQLRRILGGADRDPAYIATVPRKGYRLTATVAPFLEGSVRRSGDRMRVTVQLIDARSGYHLWSATYDQAMTDTIKIQEDISRSVAEALSARLTTDTAERKQHHL
jgi:DNA-binding winged helix-turn-helix (wHTH) protein